MLVAIARPIEPRPIHPSWREVAGDMLGAIQCLVRRKAWLSIYQIEKESSGMKVTHGVVVERSKHHTRVNEASSYYYWRISKEHNKNRVRWKQHSVGRFRRLIGRTVGEDLPEHESDVPFHGEGILRAK